MKNVTVTIPSHEGPPLSLTVTAPYHNHGLVFVMPGDGGKTSSPHNAAIVQAYLDKDYAVAEINEENPRETQYSGNLEADHALQEKVAAKFKSNLSIAILYLTSHLKFTDHFSLAGHSMGGYAALAVAAEFGPLVHHVTAVSPANIGKFIESPNVYVPTHLFVGESDEPAVVMPMKTLHKRLGANGHTLEIIKGGDHQFNGAQDRLQDAVHRMLNHYHPHAPGHINSMALRL